MYFTDHKQRKGKERGKERGAEEGSGLQFGSRFGGARTLKAGTWHGLRESLLPLAPGAHLCIWGTGEERRAGGKGIRVEAEVDEGDRGFSRVGIREPGRWHKVRAG